MDNEIDVLKHKLKMLSEHLTRTTEELEKCRRSVKVANVPSGNAWFWSGDRSELSHNGITLTCPVVIEAEDLSSIFDELDLYKKWYSEEKAARNTACEELLEKEKTVFSLRDEINEEYEARKSLLSKFGSPGDTLIELIEKLVNKRG